MQPLFKSARLPTEFSDLAGPMSLDLNRGLEGRQKLIATTRAFGEHKGLLLADLPANCLTRFERE